MKWLGLWMLLVGSNVQSTEYLYPVGIDEHADLAYLIYQKNPYHIELWKYDLASKVADQALLSRYTPAGFVLMPDGKGYSFVDNGILKVQKFLKRSPRTIEFDAPLYQTEVISWVDEQSCYTSGKYRDHFGIFQIDLEGQVQPLCIKSDIDCMYPQKVGEDLFYIERDSSWQYRICCGRYQPQEGYDFNERLAAYAKTELHTHELISFGACPIVFLKMFSDSLGYVLSHPQEVSRMDSAIPFEYYEIRKESGGWQSSKLFDFEIPGHLLLLGSPMRLYESILPLLPCHQGQTIVYPNNVQNELNLCAYNCSTGQTKVLQNGKNLFPPVGHLCGGVIDDSRVALKITDSDSVQVKLIENSL